MTDVRFTFWHKVGATLLLLGIVGGGYTGWRWMERVTLQEISMHGLVNVSEDEVHDLIRVDTGRVMIDINTVLLEDRIRRHPWIESASVSRVPSGRLDIQLEERTPVALLFNSAGVSSTYMDSRGHRMPATERASYDVPLITGDVGIYHPMRRIEDASTLELLRALAGLGPRTEGLISELVRIDSGWELRLAASGSHDSIPVWLGREGFADKFRYVQAFWDAEILRHQNKVFELVDLRFNSQIVVREHNR